MHTAIPIGAVSFWKFRWIAAWSLVIAFGLLNGSSAAQVASKKSDSPKFESIWDRSNLVAWCIVPFDSQKRSPAERVAMLDELRLRRFAYDYRADHLPTFDIELQLLREHQIELTAVWFPTRLTDDAKYILGLLKKHQIQTQLWVMGGGDLKMSESDADKFLSFEVERIRSIATEAQAIGCKVALYNHGNWFGEPENQIAIIERLKMPNVGIVYNLHHAHSQLDRLPAILSKIKAYLLAINVNGMRTDGDRIGHKILPIGEGDRDLVVLEQIEASGYRGPIGILNHTDEDAKQRLQDNIEGLEWMRGRIEGKSGLTKPTWRSYRGTALYHPTLGKQLAEQASKEGDIGRGLRLFAAESTACLSCHAIGSHGGKVGPELTSIGTKKTAEQIVTSLLWPHQEIEPAYQTYQILTDDGRVVRGYRVSEHDEAIVIREPASGVETKIDRTEIEEEKVTGSVMPETLVASLPRQDQLDLIAFVSSLGRSESLQQDVLASVLAHARSHKAASFPLLKQPLDPDLHPWHTHPINRDRVYDFYAKQAEYFRTQDLSSVLLSEYPGLDGVEFGHWGNQTEETWAGDEWNQVVLGSLQCHSFKSKGPTLARTVCVRLGIDGVAAACFNTDTLQYEAIWTGGFVSFSSVRHGFMEGVKPVGEMQPVPKPVVHQQPIEYQGFYRMGGQTIFAYRVGDVDYLDSADFVNNQFVRTRMPATEHPLNACLKGAPAVENDTIETSIETGSGVPYAIDTIALPLNNRWNLPFFCGDLDFKNDGSLYVSTMHGDVWHVSGLSDLNSKKAVWRRFASGLHQPLGLVVHNDQCYVLGRNQITKLHDLNHDGQADWYECFSTAMASSSAGHDFICGLQRDSQGNFYTVSGNQGLLKISPNGKQLEVLGTGLRNPDGLGLLPDGSLTIPCSEGDWTPTSMICLRKPTRSIPSFYGSENMSGTAPAAGSSPQISKEAPVLSGPVASANGSHLDTLVRPTFYGHRGPEVGGRPELPILYLPRGVDNSSGGQVYVSSDQWGPLKGSFVHLSHGTGTAMHVMLDEVDGQSQAAAIVLPGEFRSGVHRGRYSPIDGKLYVVGMNGWGSYAPDNGCLQRMRYTDDNSPTPVHFRAHENGVAIEFSTNLHSVDDASRLIEKSNYFAQVWNYRYSANYGSAEYSSVHPGVRGHDRLAIQAIHILEDGKTLFLEMQDLQIVNQFHLHFILGQLPAIDLYATIHRLDKPRTDIPNYRAVAKKLSAHPIEFDLANATKRKPNPWRKKIKEARAIAIEAGQNLSYSHRELRVQANEPLALTFNNPDVVPHNWALLVPGSLQRVGDLTNRLIGDPDAALNQYIPISDDVLCYTDIIDSQDKGIIYFNAPSTPGRYPFICTFPGHWMVMNGEMIVE
ncbi:MAG: DUF6797 domain-containing protein [Pirellulaceae bacterium]|nr:DUF6797 domain-containing protein [Pirellulaceae bacterium]